MTPTTLAGATPEPERPTLFRTRDFPGPDEPYELQTHHRLPWLVTTPGSDPAALRSARLSALGADLMFHLENLYEDNLDAFEGALASLVERLGVQRQDQTIEAYSVEDLEGGQDDA